MASCTPTSPSLKWKRHGFVCCISFPFSSFGFIWLLLFTPKELLWTMDVHHVHPQNMLHVSCPIGRNKVQGNPREVHTVATCTVVPDPALAFTQCAVQTASGVRLSRLSNRQPISCNQEIGIEIKKQLSLLSITVHV